MVFLCHDGKGNYLLHQRGPNTRDEAGRWDWGGGAVEFGENIEDALRREIREEYRAEALDYEFLGFRQVHREADGKKTHWIAFDYRARVDPAQVSAADPDVEKIGWFKMNDLPQPLHSQIPTALEKYRAKLL